MAAAVRFGHQHSDGDDVKGMTILLILSWGMQLSQFFLQSTILAALVVDFRSLYILINRIGCCVNHVHVVQTSVHVFVIQWSSNLTAFITMVLRLCPTTIVQYIPKYYF